MIEIIPQFGLCNRLRAMDSAFALAQDHDVALRVQWELTPELNCRFVDLFEPPQLSVPIEIVDTDAAGGVSTEAISGDQVAQLRSQDWSRLLDKDVCITTSFSFYGSCRFAHFVPVKPLLQQIDKLGITTESTIGVHVRRTDHVQAIEQSTTDKFIRKMTRMIDENSSTDFFLATDDREEEARLEERFANRIVKNRAKLLCRESTSGMQHAVIDLFGLSRTRLIVGSSGSSFSETAAAIAKVPLEVISNRNVPASVDSSR